MQTLHQLIEAIIARPEIYIGKPSVDRLYAFISGFLIGSKEADDHCLDGFNAYIAQKYRLNTSHNWSSILQFFSTSEQAAFDLFVRHFQEFTDLKQGQPGVAGADSFSQTSTKE